MLAFHWFATRAALQEFSRVLRPGGHLVLIWNRKDESIPWAREIEELLTKYQDDAPRYRYALASSDQTCVEMQNTARRSTLHDVPLGYSDSYIDLHPTEMELGGIASPLPRRSLVP